uniref:preprotein translocase subunit SecA n=1 Tax=Gemmiger formicilis TaxID=745368 RepID=UPI00402752DB
MSFFEKLFGSFSDKELKRINPLKDKVLALEPEMAKLTDDELKAKTTEFKERLAKGETLDDLLPEAFAVCREADWRVLGMKPYPVQIIGGIVLHRACIAEMQTGEGKTLVATMPTYLNALTGEGVHVVTVNDYLARRDSEWMGKVYRFLGLTVGLVVHGVEAGDRKKAYEADVTYGTNNEFGFDYLRDNMVVYKANMVQRGHAFAIVDEVDSILIDEARTPLIISGKGEDSSVMYKRADDFAKTLKKSVIVELDDKVEAEEQVDGDYVVDEKRKTATLTESGVKKAEAFFHVENLADADNMSLRHYIDGAIKARGVMHRDTDYIVKDGEVIIVDEFTGRLMYGRRFNDGLHQAIEAKEGVTVAAESKTLATVTFQNYFRMYKKLSGMTGTASTEADEFSEIYGLNIVSIPTNKPRARKDLPDSVYKTVNGKYNAVIEQVAECHAKGQPVLVGTVSVEKSEALSKLLKKKGIEHNVLNAKQHEREAEIVAQAGKQGAVTIATNMAGRGTDIMLGGNAEYLAKNEMRKMGFEEEMIVEATGYGETDDEKILNARKTFQELEAKHKEQIKAEAEEVRAAGGLFILGTERHESRRIDNQLRGRAGRQGDPGESRFFLSLEDDIMRLFGGERVQALMETLKIDETEPIQMKMLTNSIESAQKKVEGRNFGIRRNVLNFDDVMNKQREIIYAQRSKVLDGEDIHESILDMIRENITETVNTYLPDTEVHDNWNIDGLRDRFMGFLTTEDDLRYKDLNELALVEKKDIIDELVNKALDIYAEKDKLFGEEMMREVERVILLKNVDRYWMDHIDNMDELKKGIYLRSYGQRDPVVEYRMEGFEMFDAMVAAIREDTVRMLLTIQIRTQEEPKREQVAKPTVAVHGDSDRSIRKEPVHVKKIGRNDPCPCGSGKKYKKCCGA